MKKKVLIGGLIVAISLCLLLIIVFNFGQTPGGEEPLNEFTGITLESDSVVTLDIDFEKLYYNMHEAKASWLYELKEWDKVLSEAKRHEITKQYRASKVFIKENTVRRNDPCPCGSGKKYKNCCGRSE